jgi:hypothetical protein
MVRVRCGMIRYFVFYVCLFSPIAATGSVNITGDFSDSFEVSFTTPLESFDH